MYAYLKGTIVDLRDDNLVLEVNDIGYNIKIAEGFHSLLPGIGNQVKIYTYTCVREDAFLLYGFLTKDDLDIFRKCITVNGIGPKGAMAILSVMDADALRMAIISGDAKSIAKAPGIGNKTAERLILELKDKIHVEELLNSGSEKRIVSDIPDNEVAKEAIEALVALGYGQKEATQAVFQVLDQEDHDVEKILKLALKYLL